MKLSSVRIEKFKRFEKLTIEGLPPTARLVVLAGPNGTGKSSLFDAFLFWRRGNGQEGWNWDARYHARDGAPGVLPDRVQLEFHGHQNVTGDAALGAIHIRTAYRNDAAVHLHQINRLGDPRRDWRFDRLAANDQAVANNLQRIAGQALEAVYKTGAPETTYADARNELNGRVNRVFEKLLPHLAMEGLGNPIETGSFYFSKGNARGFHYDNLSGGEKAIFDLVLDLIVQGRAFGPAVYCIDEPEAHVNPNLHAELLDQLLSLVPEGGQLWIATHSIGMLRRARNLQRKYGADQVAFLDFDKPFDQPVLLSPIVPDRAFWNRALVAAAGDLADLVAPEIIIFCEGHNPNQELGAGTDAEIYATIFAAEKPEAVFTSLGGAKVVVGPLGSAAAQLFATIKGTRVIRLVDGDQHTATERFNLLAQGVRPLSRRHIESYLFDDEILARLCHARGRPDMVQEFLSEKARILQIARQHGYAPDDIKKSSANIRVAAGRLLGAQAATVFGFMVDHLAPLVTPDTQTYQELKQDIFG